MRASHHASVALPSSVPSRVLSALNPIGTASAQDAAFGKEGRKHIVPVSGKPDPLAGGPENPDKGQGEQFQKIDPTAGYVINPDGTLETPTLLPALPPGSAPQEHVAIHGVALTTAGATSLVHEAKVDVITVPGLSEHLSNAATTTQLSARFAYAGAMKSINDLLLPGDGESWARERVDFGGPRRCVPRALSSRPD